MMLHPRIDRIAYGSHLLPLLSSSTQKASGVSLPISNSTCPALTFGKSIPAKCDHLLISDPVGSEFFYRPFST
ncbi:hypothetical protein DPMN_071474 [Dreissena polymorpha]|uniref:Uncharacterized protein n=1 Tax=Dreissena polymorpha TaxID=45954 RepID=A0A9D4BVT2_DREPO|nr:hypothetical protein DPMN_071474 [Dreissena polymorpha]